mmetsp:Transcript_33443/g.54244  ORF Transcript_33443/g.54244 Transcript_33443/m.54244 type:complete len:232 (+) Transcript_33443:265-960(+)|eukprot:CAMPEP_0184658424 /NCGR_PEP_ID=MMETSP0308-20130426/25321_1 /TAXON_ID=38269 /ORGANISM="Gloeochaete witrockiana, Strain SAG 46.84" /LENGTH=231 /DNA_ID=CAMNT_0027097391 /DNA_START=212 /DNA_END=907 /DNA_ORIENTATION=-
MSSKKLWCVGFVVVFLLSTLSDAHIPSVRNFFVSELFTRLNDPTNPWKASFSTQVNSGIIPNRNVLAYSKPPQWAPPVQVLFMNSCIPASPSADYLPCPHIVFNQLSTSYPTYYSEGKLLPKQILMHAGPNGEFTRIGFTAPARATYKIDADFYANNIYTSVDIHLFVKGVEWWSTYVNGDSGANYYVPHRISTEVLLNAGQKIEFAEGYGDNQEWSYDWLGVQIHIQATY